MWIFLGGLFGNSPTVKYPASCRYFCLNPIILPHHNISLSCLVRVAVLYIMSATYDFPYFLPCILLSTLKLSHIPSVKMSKSHSPPKHFYPASCHVILYPAFIFTLILHPTKHMLSCSVTQANREPNSTSRVVIELSLLSKYPVVNDLYSAIFSLDIQIFYFLRIRFFLGQNKKKLTWLVVDSRLTCDSRSTWAHGWLV